MGILLLPSAYFNSGGEVEHAVSTRTASREAIFMLRPFACVYLSNELHDSGTKISWINPPRQDDPGP